MTENETITLIIDRTLKDKATELFNSLGMDLSTATAEFYRRAIERNGLPFDSGEPNEETAAAMREAERIARDPNVKGYTDLDELFSDLKR